MDKYLVRALQARGVEVVTAIEAGLVERPDEDHLAYGARFICRTFACRSERSEESLISGVETLR